MKKIIDLSQPGDSAKIVHLEHAPESRAARVVKGLGTVGLVAGTIAAGALAARAHLRAGDPKRK